MSQIRHPFIWGFSGGYAKQVGTVLPFSQSMYVETNFIPFLFAVTSGDCYHISLGLPWTTNPGYLPLSPHNLYFLIISIPLWIFVSSVVQPEQC